MVRQRGIQNPEKHLRQKGRKTIFEGCNNRGNIVRLPLRALGCHKGWKCFSFCEIWNNPILSLFFIRPPDKKALQDIEFYDKLVDRFQDLSKVKNPTFSKAKVWKLLRAIKRKWFFGEIWYCHIDHGLLESSLWYGFKKLLN